MDSIKRRPGIVCILLGAAAACGFAPLELWPLTLACFAAWMWLVHEAPTLKSALWRGYAFGVGHFTINDNWFQHAFDFQDKMPPELGYAAPFALALYLAVYPAMAAGLAWRFRRVALDGGYVLIFAAAWIVTEWLRATVFTGYAWDPLGVIWVPVQAIAGLAAYLGTYALSGLTILLAGAMLLLAKRRWWLAPLALLLPLALQPFSYLRHTEPALPADHPRLVVVQPNVGQEQRGDRGEFIKRKLIEMSGRPGPAPRLVLWPEGVIDDPIEDGYPAWIYAGSTAYLKRVALAQVLGPRDVLVTGGSAYHFNAREEVDSAANSVFAISPNARILGRYDKAHLVPYGEYLPMPWLLKPLGLARVVPGNFDFAAGPGPRSIALAGFGRVGIQVCYEIIFSGEVVEDGQRPTLIFNPSNDAWFGKWGPPQHLAQARMRAIEEGLPVIRATPTGISAVIAADGRLIATVPHETAGVIETAMPQALPPTLFSRVGNWMAALVAALLVLAAVVIRRRAR